MFDCTAGGDRIWKVRYRVKDGGKRIERKLPIGLLDPEARRRTGNEGAYLSPGQARDRADDVLGAVRNGADPWLEEHKKANEPKPEVLSVEAVYREWLASRNRRAVVSCASPSAFDADPLRRAANIIGDKLIAALKGKSLSDKQPNGDSTG